MKQQTHTNLLIRSSFAVALAIWSPVGARSAEPAEEKNMTGDKTIEHSQEMKKPKQTMNEHGTTMKGYVQDIESLAVKNNDFRRVLYTAENCQLVLMALKPKE